jgi:acyl-CoA synthetase (NDP forming)
MSTGVATGIGDALPSSTTCHAAGARREGPADVASLGHVFRPGSVAVVGTSRRTGTVGRAILHNIVTGGYQGKVYAINPHAFRMEGLRCLPSVTALPEPAELAVIAVPAARVGVVADQCGRRGVGALVVISAGLDALQEADLLAICRRYGMRLVGPDCFGIAAPGIGLDATFGARRPAPGVVGLVTQSSGLGLALAERLSLLGLGISTFASVGGQCDVSGNDMLRWWEHDETTRLAVLDVESFGNPRAFVAAARQAGAVMPVLGLLARVPGGRRGDRAAACPPPVTDESLLEQAGVIAVHSPGAALATAALLTGQPVPAGRRVAVISNVGAAAALAAGACAGHGLVVHTPSAEARRRLHALVPPGGTVTGPVDTTAAVTERTFRRCLELVAGDEGVDAVLALVLPTAAGDLVTAVRTAGVRVPLATVVLDQAENVRLLAPAAGRAPGAGPSGCIPAYCDPETAAAALARAAAYGAWRARAPGRAPVPRGVREGDARELVREFLAGSPHGGWLPPGQVAGLLECYGVPPDPQAPGAPRVAGFVIGASREPAFGPLVTFGVAGTEPAGPGRPAARLVPLTEADADDLIAAAGPAPARMALRETLLRVSRLADGLPEVAELSLGCVITLGGGVSAAGARIRLAPVAPRGLPRREPPPIRAVGPHRRWH